MLNKLTPLVAALALAATAHADPTRDANSPDFVDRTPGRHIDKDLASSPGEHRLRPSAVLLFGFDSSAIAAVDMAELESARTWIANHPRLTLVIEGHTDASGSFEYNTYLAARRADAVREELIELGADPAQLVVGVFGEALATSPNPQANRRVIVRGTAESVATITRRAYVDAHPVLWDYQPGRAVARR